MAHRVIACHDRRVIEQSQAVKGDYANTQIAAAELPVDIRPIRPDDRPALERWFATVSPESRYARFLGFVTELSPGQWRYLTEVDGRDHVAYLAWYQGRIAGVARWIRY